MAHASATEMDALAPAAPMGAQQESEAHDPARTWDLPRDPLDDKLLELCMSRNETSAAEVQAVIDEGADPSIIGDYNYTALMWAIVRNKTDVVHTLLENGANMENINAWGRNAIFIAAWEGHTAVMKDLIEHGVNVSGCARHDGWTALHKAAEMGHLRQVQMLLEAGADPTALTTESYNDDEEEEGLTPLSLAKTVKTKELLQAAIDSKSPLLSEGECQAAAERFKLPINDTNDEVLPESPEFADLKKRGRKEDLEKRQERRRQRKAARAAKEAAAQTEEEEAKRMLMQKDEV